MGSVMMRQFPASVSATAPNRTPQLLSANQNRSYLLIQNGGTASAWIGIGIQPDAISGLELPGGASLEIRDPAPANEVFGFCASGVAELIIVEG